MKGNFTHIITSSDIILLIEECLNKIFDFDYFACLYDIEKKGMSFFQYMGNSFFFFFFLSLFVWKLISMLCSMETV